ncbi:MAG: tagatose 1,6-diphosphate aldolase [Anaerolineae bacterium]|nr:tagatose 1,6-diphosphate aldolase [Anaerolineae bacterium]
MQTISPGRWRGLRQTSLDGDVFAILAFDQRGTYRKMLPEGTSYERAAEVKAEIVAALSVKASAVLLDNEYGLASALTMSRSSGLLMSLEKSGYSGDATYRRIEFLPDWNVGDIRAMGASAVKLLAYYHPGTGALAEEIEGIIAGVIRDSHAQGLPVFLEPLCYSLDAAVSKESAAFAELRPPVVIETARRLGALGPDVLKMEFPYDAAYHHNHDEWRAACEAISAASDVPWVLLSAGVDFATFADQARIACQAGASGWLAGRAIWKEAVTMSDADRARFLQTTALDRMQRLVEVSQQYGRPWTQLYGMPANSPTWYKR